MSNIIFIVIFSLIIAKNWQMLRYYILCSFLYTTPSVFAMQRIRSRIILRWYWQAEINQRVYTNKGISPPNNGGNAETKSNLDIVNARIINLPISFENIRSLPVS